MRLFMGLSYYDKSYETVGDWEGGSLQRPLPPTNAGLVSQFFHNNITYLFVLCYIPTCIRDNIYNIYLLAAAAAAQHSVFFQ